MKLLYSLLLLFSLTLSSCNYFNSTEQQKNPPLQQDEIDFLLRVCERTLINPKSSDIDYCDALNLCSDYPGGGLVIMKSARMNRKTEWKYYSCCNQLYYIASKYPDFYPQEAVIDLIEYAETIKPYLAIGICKALGNLKSKGSSALPGLKRLENNPNPGLALAAYQASKKIRSSLLALK